MAPPDSTGGSATLGPAARIGIVREYMRIGLQAMLLFVAAGRLDWASAWIYLGVVTLFQTGLTLALARRNPGLLEARGRIQAGSKRWDVALVIGAFLLAYAVLVVAGLDSGRSPERALPAWLSGLAVLAFLAASALIAWAMLENAHFEGFVRIQHDRDHRVCTTGPYAIVRHPGYLGIVVAGLSAPLVLGSARALLLAIAPAALFVLRTALEDRTLQRELAGYTEYTKTTTARLIPGLW